MAKQYMTGFPLRARARLRAALAATALAALPALAAPRDTGPHPDYPTTAVTLEVPPAMAGGPLATPRKLVVPQGFRIRVYGRVPNARFMALAPNGDLLVSNPRAGNIMLLRPDQTQTSRAIVFADNLRRPHDIVFHKTGDATWIYIAESHRIIRTRYTEGSSKTGPIEVVVDNLPDRSTPELGGAYGHELKNIALRADKLYVSIASTCNACESDTVSDPIRNAVYEYDLNGKNRRLYARGLRNAEGIRFLPGTGELWVTVNNRDNIAYPFHKDWDGDGKDDYGRIMESYVDGHPPDLLVRVRDGGNYGWPFCNSNPDAGIDNMPYDRDVQLNPDGSKLDCDRIDRATKGLPAHSAPLGMSFLHEAGLPEPWRNGVVTALHGCWNCSKLNGHKVVYYPIAKDGSVGDGVDMVSGWLLDAKSRERWGRPVTAIPDGKGGLFISDDHAGAVYQLYRAK